MGLGGLPLKKCGDGGEGVDVRRGLVGAEAGDARKAEGIATGVAIRFLNVVESNFEDDERFDSARVAVIFEGVVLEELGELGDFGIGEARISFADIEEPVAIANGESVIRQCFVALAVAEFDSGDNDVERGIGLLEFEPIATAAARGVGRVGGFGDDAFVASSESVLEGLLNGFGRRTFGEVCAA